MQWIVVALIVSLMACTESGFVASSDYLDISSLNVEEKWTCQFVDVDVLSNMLKYQLGISSGDTPMLKDNGSPKSGGDCGNPAGVPCMYLDNYATVLGQADFAADILGDTTCGANKFKVVTEVFINSCFTQMKVDEVQQRLFPNGVSEFDEIFLAVLGRVPKVDETEIILELQDEFESEDAKAGAACSVLFSSVEALVTI